MNYTKQNLRKYLLQHQKINLTEEMRELYTENYKSLMKQTNDTNKWRDSCTKRMEELKLLKCPYYPKPSFWDSVQSLSKFKWHFSQKQEKKSPEFVQNH